MDELTRLKDVLEAGRERQPTPHSKPPDKETSDYGDPDCRRCRGAGYVRRNPNAQPGDPAFGSFVRCDCNPPDFRAGFPARFAAASFGDYGLASTPILWDAAVRCAALINEQTWAVFLFAKRGAGKTHLSYATLYEWRVRHWREDDRWGGVFVVADMLAHFRSRFDVSEGPTLDDMVEAHCRGRYLLVLDDLAAEKDTEWGREQIFRIIDGRYRRELPTLVTSNAHALKDLDERITDRLAEGLIVIPGESRRAR